MMKNKTIVICINILALSLGFAIYAATQERYRDPTQPISGSSQKDNSNPYNLKIDSIIISKDRKIVSINGRYLKIGDKIDEITIVDIYPQGARLKDNFGEFTINMPYYNIRSSVDNAK